MKSFRNVFCGAITIVCFAIPYLCILSMAGTICYFMYSITTTIDHRLHNVPTNCTIMETNTKSNGDWDIQVSYSVPGSSLNYTQTLQNTITDAVYRVGRTITCYYATNDNAYIMANVVSVSGGTIFALIILCILCIPLVFGVMYLLRIVLVYISDHLKAMAKSISQNLANCATKLRSLFKTEGFESQSECDTSSPEKLMSNRDVGYALMPIANFKASLGHTKLWLKARCTFSRPNTNLHKDMCQESFITQDTFGCSPTSTEELPLYSKDGCNVPP